jgi:acetyltransferase-like isoleucine patch superfamily enzyme
MGLGNVPKGVKVGCGTYFGDPPTILWDKYGSKLIVGNYTSISANVTFFLGGHHYANRISMRLQRHGRFSYSKGSIKIGSDCWIGHGAVVLDGVTIADGAVVAAFAVVAKDVPPYAIVAGNPAQVVKYRFDVPTCKSLLTIKWWNWPKDKITEALPLMRVDDVREFIRRYG